MAAEQTLVGWNRPVVKDSLHPFFLSYCTFQPMPETLCSLCLFRFLLSEKPSLLSLFSWPSLFWRAKPLEHGLKILYKAPYQNLGSAPKASW